MNRAFKLTLVALAAFALSVPASAWAQGGITVDKNLAKNGKKLYTNKGCNACHVLGKASAGPDLLGMLQRRDHDWLRRWLKDTEEMLATDSLAKALLAEYKGVKMPNMKLTDADIDALFHYIQEETQKRGG